MIERRNQMTEQEKSQKILAAEEALRQAKARLSRAKREEKEKNREKNVMLNKKKNMNWKMETEFLPLVI